MQQVVSAAVGAVVCEAVSAADDAAVGAALGTICDGSDRCNGRGIGQFTGGLNDDGGSVMIYCPETLSATTMHSPSKNMLTCLHTTIHSAAEVGPIAECRSRMLKTMFGTTWHIN